MRTRTAFFGIASFLGDILFPPRCPACGAVWRGFCDTCAGCVVGAYGFESIQGICAGVFAAYEYSGAAREAVLNLKFHGRKDAAAALAPPLFCALPKRVIAEADVLAYVPASPKRESERGYNQARLLAKSLSALIGKPVVNALSRTTETAPLYEMTRAQRETAMRGAIAAQGDDVAGKTVLLVDDIITTGATARAAVSALIGAGVKAVYCAAVCVSAEKTP